MNEIAAFLMAVARHIVSNTQRRVLASTETVRWLAEHHQVDEFAATVDAASFGALGEMGHDTRQRAAELLAALARLDERVVDDEPSRAGDELVRPLTGLLNKLDDAVSGRPGSIDPDDPLGSVASQLAGVAEPFDGVLVDAAEVARSHISSLSLEEQADALGVVAAALLGRSPKQAALDSCLVLLVALLEHVVGGLERAVAYHRFAVDEPPGSDDLSAVEEVETRLEGYGRATFRTRVKTLFSSIEADEVTKALDLVIELTERRHVIVHHWGHISPSYKRYVRDDHPDNLGIRSTDSAYVDQACANAIVFSAWAQARLCTELFGLVGPAAASLVDYSVNLLERGAWPSVVLLADMTGFPHEYEDASSIDVLYINWWTARSEMEGASSITDEVGGWNPRFPDMAVSAARACLLRDYALAAELANRAVRAGELTLGALRRWPAFAGLRASNSWSNVTRDVKTQEDDSL